MEWVISTGNINTVINLPANKQPYECQEEIDSEMRRILSARGKYPGRVIGIKLLGDSDKNELFWRIDDSTLARWGRL
jgi:hypothetical protein